MSICPRCASEFTCAMKDNTGHPCWCTALPPEAVLPIYPQLLKDEGVGCFCPDCLQEWQEKGSGLG